MKLSRPLQEAGTIITPGFWQSKQSSRLYNLGQGQTAKKLQFWTGRQGCLAPLFALSMGAFRVEGSLYCTLCKGRLENMEHPNCSLIQFINHICWDVREAVHYSLESRTSNPALLMTSSGPVDKLLMCFETGVSFLSSVRMNDVFRITMKTKWCVAWKMCRVQFEEGLSGQEC